MDDDEYRLGTRNRRGGLREGDNRPNITGRRLQLEELIHEQLQIIPGQRLQEFLSSSSTREEGYRIQGKLLGWIYLFLRQLSSRGFMSKTAKLPKSRATGIAFFTSRLGIRTTE